MGGVCKIAGHDAPACTDNFQIVRPPFGVAGHKFHSAEQAYQASKFPVDSVAFQLVTAASPEGMTDEEFGMEVWSIGNSSQVRENWDGIKVKSMYVANLCKFAQNQTLADELRGTQGEIEAARSTWRWQFFNSRIMAKIRDLLITGASLRSELERVELLDGRAVEQELESYS